MIYCTILITSLAFFQQPQSDCVCTKTQIISILNDIGYITDEPSLPITESPTNHPTLSPSEAVTEPPTEIAETITNPPTNAPTLQPTTDEFIGDYKVSARNASHGNWLLCDGSFIDSKEYPKLFDIIGYSFGSFSTFPSHFGLPDARDRVVGINGYGNIMGESMGNEQITLSESNLPTHFHYVLSSGFCSGYYDATSRPYLAFNCNSGSGLLTNENFEYTLRATSTTSNQYRSSTVGSGTAISIMQPTVFVGNLFIYAD